MFCVVLWSVLRWWYSVLPWLLWAIPKHLAARCCTGRRPSQPPWPVEPQSSAGATSAEMPQSKFTFHLGDLLHPKGSYPIFETCQTVCGSSRRVILHFLSCMSAIALSKQTNIAFVSVTDTILPTPLCTLGAISVIIFLLELPATSVPEQKPEKKLAFSCQLLCANDFPFSITFH